MIAPWRANVVAVPRVRPGELVVVAVDEPLRSEGERLVHAAGAVPYGWCSCPPTRIRGQAGTDLTRNIEGQDWQIDALPLQAGGIANHPGGKVFVLPRTANGRLVADVAVDCIFHAAESRADGAAVSRST